MDNSEWWEGLKSVLMEGGLSQSAAAYTNAAILLLITIAIVAIVDFLLWKIIRWFAARMAKRTRTNFDNFAVTNRLPRFLAHILPLLLAFELAPLVFHDFDYTAGMVLKGLRVIGIFLMLSIVRRFLKTINDYLKTKPDTRINPSIVIYRCL